MKIMTFIHMSYKNYKVRLIDMIFASIKRSNNLEKLIIQRVLTCYNMLN